MLRLISLLLVALLWTVSARAEIVDDLYAATVPVRDQGASALALAAQLGLAQVLVKVSGSEAILRNPEISRVMPSARTQVQQYAYVPPVQRQGKLQVRIEFPADYVTGLVIGAGEPLWTANRPAVLAWLVTEDESGLRFITPESDPELVDELRRAFAQRGVPLQLPLYDLADSAAIRPEEAWQLDGAAVQSASGRYAMEHVVAARVIRMSSGRWVGDWSYFESLKRSDRRIEADTAEEYLAQGVALVAGEMARRYAVLPSATVSDTVPVSVIGVSNYADYAAIVTWLERLELVHGVRVRGLNGDRLELGVDAQADAAQLATLIALNRDLVAMSPALPGRALEYQWQR